VACDWTSAHKATETHARVLAWILYCNSLPEGGTRVPWQGHTRKVGGRGKLADFPCGVSHIHRGRVSEEHSKTIAHRLDSMPAAWRIRQTALAGLNANGVATQTSAPSRLHKDRQQHGGSNRDRPLIELAAELGQRPFWRQSPPAAISSGFRQVKSGFQPSLQMKRFTTPLIEVNGSESVASPWNWPAQIRMHRESRIASKPLDWRAVWNTKRFHCPAHLA